MYPHYPSNRNRIDWLDAEPQLLGTVDQEAVLESLDPSIRVLARALLERRPELTIVSGYRSLEEQERLYRQGREDPGEIVTNAKPGTSWHNYALAFDVTPPSEAAGREGERLGLRWGGRFRSFKDPNHFEYHPGLTLDDAAAGRRPPVPQVPQGGERRVGGLVAFAVGAGLALGAAKLVGWI